MSDTGYIGAVLVQILWYGSKAGSHTTAFITSLEVEHLSAEPSTKAAVQFSAWTVHKSRAN